MSPHDVDSKPTGFDADSLPSENESSSADTIALDLNRVLNLLRPVAGEATVVSWQKSLTAVHRESSRPPGVVVGFVGITGAGKSSLINALLGDHIVPTSGFESCTSTPIHISYHDSETVKARIEFIPVETWLEDISHLIEALAAARGQESELNDDDTEIWQRINTVYPQYSAKDLLASTPDAILASDPDVAGKLGTTVIFDAQPRFFNNSLQNQCTVRDSVDVWPTIAQVSLQCRAPVLKDGVTLVDLPGVLDSNTARAAIATEYLKKCDRVFVVASIKRAVTDRVAEGLMGEAFKSQMLNGKYNSESIAFIATSTDDVQVSELVSRLGLAKVASWKALALRLRGLEDELSTVCKELEQIPAQKHPSPTPQPRTSSRDLETGQPTPKRQRIDSEERAAGGLHMITSPERTQSLVNGVFVSWTAETISAKEDRRDSLRASISDLANERKRYCIAARNTRVCKELQRQFKLGLRNTKGDDDDGEVLGNIKVFTVSAREYLKLQGKIPEGDDDAQPVFRTLEETGVPEVADFIRQVGQKILHGWKERHASGFSALVSQIESWISVNTSGSQEDRAELEAAWNGANPDLLGPGLPYRIGLSILRISRGTYAKIQSDLQNVLECRMREAAVKPGESIGDQFQVIAAKVKHYNTIKALLRRGGKWKGNDWNRDLVEFLRRGFRSYWHKVFSMPSLSGDVTALVEAITTLLSELEASSPPGLLQHVQDQKDATLKLVAFHAREAALTCEAAIMNRQKEISREMITNMADKMQAAYDHALTLAGPKFRANAVSSIHDHLVEHGGEYFSDIVESAIKTLNTAVSTALDEYCTTLDKLTSMIESRMKPTSAWEGSVADTRLHETVKTVRAALEPIVSRIEEYRGSQEGKIPVHVASPTRVIS